MSQTQKTIFLLLSGIAVIFLCTLGVWQAERLEWKTALIEEMAEAKNKPFINVNIMASNNVFEESFYKYRKAHASGVVMKESAHYLIPRVHDGKSGGHVVQLVRLIPSHKYMIVDKGWLGKDDAFSTFKNVASFNAKGRVRPFPTKGTFQPENQIDDQEIYWIDRDFFIEKFKLSEEDLVPFIFEQTSKSRFETLIPHSETLELRNMHYYYACFWFTMAFLLTLFAAFFLYKMSSNKE